MSLHRITAGSGYDYLTRQVAAMDSTEKGHAGLASYYTEKGETPGVWVGSGLVGIDGLDVGDVVTAQQMVDLFGSGHHPLAQQRVDALTGRGLTENDYIQAARLGKPFKVYSGDVSDFRIEVARRLERLNTLRGRPVRAITSIEDRARIRTEVATEMFRAEHRRDPLDGRELAGHIAKLSRQRTTAVAGFDLTFSPVKSVSALWAVAPPSMAATIERAHRQAIADALRFIEKHALFTRTGTNGVRQVEVRGLVAAAFTHRDSRAGDPDLHTHVAVANKVQTVEDGRWLSIDSRLMHKAWVAASETYNTALERHLATSLGVRFEARTGPDQRKREVREIVGVSPDLNRRWSTRRRSIETRRRVLAARFQADHGRPPSPVESIALAQQATLETRDAKHEPRSLAEQRATWRVQAVDVLGSAESVTQMVWNAVHPPPDTSVVRVDAEWVERISRLVLGHVQARRSSWQTWHLRAEAQRQVRAAQVPTDGVEDAVDLLVARAVQRSQPLIKPGLGEPDEPAPLSRSDGASVYSVAGAQLFTSSAMLAAEARLVQAAGLRDGKVVPATAVDLALLETEANGTRLNPGQVLLVREMASSGARVQLAIAPAGSGKTTAMSALSRAWTGAGGTVIGLAPSAAAAAGIGVQLEGHADTLAKLVWSLDDLASAPAWVLSIGPDTLVIIDEAGMADTLSLDAAVQHIVQCGGSVRLIGDDQQLAAIGAGGVLRDIQANHGALHLSELVRFTDRAEGSASLALRGGHTSALGFYLDQRRIHVGDQTTMADDLFAAWSADTAGGLDSIMLAPTRDLVADLNHRARSQRLDGAQPEHTVLLADGNEASIGDTIISRTNDRRLRCSTTDWVKNGDRWRVLELAGGGAIRAQHTQSGTTVLLPAQYVPEAVELGYACTTHTAQGVTADTMHGLLTGTESRQHTYTMLTRGREANHAYVVVVGDGDPHTVIRPETINPLTPTDLLERILARDESPISATTSLREASSPSMRLGDAAERYSDAITFAAGHAAGPDQLQNLHDTLKAQLPQLTHSDTWPVLRAQLLLVAADGRDPLQALAAACNDPVHTALDPCAVLSWRIADASWRNQRGPLPWLTRIPSTLANHPLWGPYLQARSSLIADLANQVRTDSLASNARPGWVAAVAGTPSADLVADVEVWRAAHKTDPADTRPTGERTYGLANVRVERQLQARIAACQSAALDEWGPLLARISPAICTDTFAPVLAARLSQLSSAGLHTRDLIGQVTSAGPLPDDHAAAALWWRLARHLSPAIAQDVDRDHHLATAWLDTFTTTLGDRSHQLQNSPWWTALVATIERGLQRGWTLQQLIDEGDRPDAAGHADPAQAWVWRLSLLTDNTEPDDANQSPDPETDAPEDRPATNWPPPDATVDATPAPLADLNDLVEPEPDPWTDTHTDSPTGQPDDVELDDDAVLTVQGMIRDRMGTPETSDADVRRMMERADQIAASPVPLERLHLVNQLTNDFFQNRLADSWAHPYLTGRLHIDLERLQQFHAGYASDSWTALVQHLHRHGISDLDMITAGVAQTASTGRLIDRFRDRAIFPIIHHGRVLGFVGRRNPACGDADNRGPKYLNTATTPIFNKGDQLFVAGTVQPGTIPVLSEGPMDAIALTLTGDGRYIGVAPLGTSLTDAHVAQLHQHGQQPIVATDPDRAGQAAAERDFWMLASYNLDPRHANLNATAADPADLVARGHSRLLRDALSQARPLGDTLIDQRLAHDPGTPATILAAVQVLAAQPSSRWTAGVEHIAEQSRIPTAMVRSALASMVTAWNADVRKAAQQATRQAAQTRRSHANPAATYETVSTNRPPMVDGPPRSSTPRRPAPGIGR